jgi:uncharacterized OsmC-like protein
MTVEHIRDSIGSTVEYLAAHPEKCRGVDGAATAVIDGLRTRVEGPRGEVVVTDMPKSIGGGATAPSPSWLLRAAIASCEAVVIAMRAAQEGVELSDLVVTVDSESDDRGLLGMDDSVPAGPLRVRIRVKIAAEGAPAERLREIVSWAMEHSPVGDAIVRAVPTTVEVEIP